MTILLSLIALLVIILAAFFVILEFSVIIIGHYKGAPFVRSKKDRVRAMIELARIKPGEFAADLGSGDGILVIEAAKEGARACGVEVNPFLVWFSRWRIQRYKNAEIKRENIYNFPLHDANIIFMYLLPSTIARLKSKLEKEVKPGTRIISNAFPVPGWDITEEENKVFLYKR